MPLAITLREKRIITTTFHSLALLATTFRLYHRRKRHRLWWDDFWALISLLFDVVYFGTVWIRDDSPNYQLSLSSRIVLYWISACSSPLIVCSARISIAMSIARFVLPGSRMRRFLFFMCCCFLLVCFALLVQKVWVCCKDTSWHHGRGVQCILGFTVGIITLSTDITADTCLVVIPLHLLWNVKLPRSQRRLILSIFAATVLSSMAGIAYAVLVFNSAGLQMYRGLIIGMAVHIKAAVTLLVCNLLVVVTYIYCIFWKDDTAEASEPSETRSKPTFSPPPTTVVSLTNITETEIYTTTESSRHPGTFSRPEP